MSALPYALRRNQYEPRTNKQNRIRRKKAGKQIFQRFFSLLFFGKQWKSDRDTLIFLAKEGLFSLFSAIAAGKAALFGVRPFALPILLCSGTHLTAATLGGCVGTLFSGDPLHSLIVLLFSVGKFLLLRYEQEDENGGKRLFTPAAAVSASLLGALLLQIFAFAREGFRFHSLLALLFSVTANGFFTFLFYGAMEIPEKAAEKAAEKTVYRPYRIAGRAALGFCAVYALSGISLFGLPLAAGGGLFLILREAAGGGSLFGGDRLPCRRARLRSEGASGNARLRDLQLYRPAFSAEILSLRRASLGSPHGDVQ